MFPFNLFLNLHTLTKNFGETLTSGEDIAYLGKRKLYKKGFQRGEMLGK